jgi:hypothetical protein
MGEQTPGRAQGFFGGGVVLFTGTAFGAGAFFGFFFSLLWEWLPLPTVVASLRVQKENHNRVPLIYRLLAANHEKPAAPTQNRTITNRTVPPATSVPGYFRLTWMA